MGQHATTTAIVAIAVIGLAPASVARPQSAGEKGLAIATEADRRDRGFGDSTSELRMVLQSRGGEERVRELRSRVLERPDDGDRSLVVFDSPADVRGTALLTYAHREGNDDQWLYLPALKRVRRIAASNRSAPFMGSEFSYEDLASQVVEKFTYRWLRDETCPDPNASVSCFVIERRPLDDTSAYIRQVLWIDTPQYRTMQIEYYDRRDRLLKTLVFSDYARYQDRFWRAEDMLMTNHQTGQRTRLLWQEYRFGVGLRESDFTPQALTRIR